MDNFSHFRVPKSWSVILLSDVLSNLETGKRPKGGVKDYTEGVVSLGGEHLNSDGGFKLDNIKFVPNSFAEKIQRAKVDINDILIVKDGATTGKTSFIDDSFPFRDAVINEHLFICRCCLDINSKYVFYFLYSRNGNKQILLDFRGAAQGGISRGFVKKAMIPLPPLNEQKRIAAKIEALQTRSNAVKEELEAIKLLLDQFRQSVLAAAFRGDLTKDWRSQNPDVEPASKLIASLQTPDPEHHLDIFKQSCYCKLPKSWTWVQLGKLGALLGGGTPSKRNPGFWNGHIPWISAKDMKIDRIEDSIDHITEEAISKSSAKIIPKSSILFVVRGMILNHTLPIAITDDVVTINQDMKALVPEIAGMSEYLLFACKFVSKQILFKVKSATHGTRRLETATLKDWAIPIPPISEQKEIVRRIESLFKLADNIEQKYQQAELDLETLNQSILAKAFRGELVPQDPNDEPASVLLEKIKEERDRAKATAKKSKTKKKSSKKKDKQLGIPGM